MSNNQHTHLYNLDLLRGLAILLVVVQHAWTMSDMDIDSWGWLCHGYRIFISCGVPLFVVLSGALLLDAPVLPMGDFYRRRFWRVAMPFLLWALAVYVLSFVTHKYDEVTSWQDFLLCFVPYLLQNRINEFHWFVHMILALYLIAPFLQRAFTLCNRRTIEGVLLVWVALLLLRAFVPGVYLLHYTSDLLPFLGCFVGGYYLKHYASGRGLRFWFIIIFAALTLVDILTKARYGFLPLLMSVALTGIFLSAPMHKAPRWGGIWVRMSRYSFMIYLIHIPIIRAVLTASGLQADPARPWLAFAQPLCLALIALTVCCLLGWVIDFMPRWVQQWTGVTGKEKK